MSKVSFFALALVAGALALTGPRSVGDAVSVDEAADVHGATCYTSSLESACEGLCLIGTEDGGTGIHPVATVTTGYGKGQQDGTCLCGGDYSKFKNSGCGGY